jgi:hypothetical protein
MKVIKKLLAGISKVLKETFGDFIKAFLIMLAIAIVFSLFTMAYQYYLIKNNIGKIVMPDGVHSSALVEVDGKSVKWTTCEDVNSYKGKKIKYNGLFYIVRDCREVVIGGTKLSETILELTKE